MEPTSGLEPLTCRLRIGCSYKRHPAASFIINNLQMPALASLVFLSCYRRFQLSHAAPHAGFRGVDVVLFRRCFVGVTAYSLYNFSRNSHLVQVGGQAASESVPPVPLHPLFL